MTAALVRGGAVFLGVVLFVTIAFESLADPARARLGPGASEAAVVALRHELALDGPLTTRVLAALSRLLGGDLGRSLALDRPVSQVVGEAWLNTLLYALPGALLAFFAAAGLVLVFASKRRDPWGNRIEIGLAGLAAVSGVVLAVAMQRLLGALGAPITAISLRDPSTSLGVASLASLLAHTAPPTLTWALLLLPSDLRIQRAASSVPAEQAWSTGMLARGLSEFRVARHVFLHALPVIASRALQRLPQLACGSVAVEAVFDVPGLGHLMLLALRTGDVVLAQGLVITMALPLVLARTLVAVAAPPRSPHDTTRDRQDHELASPSGRLVTRATLEVQP